MTRALAVLAVTVVGCREPVAGLGVVRDGDHYIVSIRDCQPEQWKIPVWDVVVKKMPAGSSNNETQCELQVDFHGGNDILEHWQYGVAPSGYRMGPCLPLRPGSTYEISVGSRPRPARGHFAVEANGDIKMIDGGCKS